MLGGSKKNHEDAPSQIKLDLSKPEFYKSAMIQNFCEIGQSYQFTSTEAGEKEEESKLSVEAGDIVRIREQCVEMPYTYQGNELLLKQLSCLLNQPRTV